MALSTETIRSRLTEPHLQKFEHLGKESNQPAWVFPLRKAGISRFAELGFPTLKDEDWRFTNVAPIANLPFNPVIGPVPNGLASDTLSRFPFQSLAATRLVFVDGCWNSHLSTSAPKGMTAASLAQSLSNNPSLIEKHLSRYAQGEDNAFTSLNTAFFQDGAFIHVPAGVSVEQPIHIVYLSTGREKTPTTNPRNLIIVEKRGHVTVLESYVSLTDDAYFTNAVTELVAEEDSVVEHCKFQDESPSAFHMAAIHARMGRHCRLISHSIATGGRLSRNNIRTALAGEGVECVLNGLYLTKGEQLADHHCRGRGTAHDRRSDRRRGEASLSRLRSRSGLRIRRQSEACSRGPTGEGKPSAESLLRSVYGSGPWPVRAVADSCDGVV